MFLALSVLATSTHGQGIPTVPTTNALATPETVFQVSLDANSLSQTDTTVSASASQSKSFRVGAVINGSMTNPLTGVYGWQYGIKYNSSSFIPVGDPSGLSLYPDGATSTVLFGGQTSPGTVNWAGLITASHAFGSFTIIPCSSVPCQVRELQVFFTLLTPAPAVTLSARTMLANVNFELLDKPSTPQFFNITDVKFAAQSSNIIQNVVRGTSAYEQIENVPPVASFELTPNPGRGPYAYTFNATSSFDRDGSIPTPVGYIWDFGDGTQDVGLAGAVVTHDYGANVSFVATLRVQDNLGATGSARDSFGDPILNNQPSHASHHFPDLPPAAIFIYTANSTNPQYVLFDGSSSYDPDGFIKQWSWDFGDGLNGTGTFAAHTYAFSGIYTVTLTVTDNAGLVSVTSKVLIVNHPRLLHDVSVSAVYGYPTVVTSTQTVTAQVAIQNSGRSNETISVIAYYNSTVLGTVTGFFLPVQSCEFCGQYVQFLWDTTGVPPGTYILSATVILPTDQFPSDNRMNGTSILVLPPPRLAVNPYRGVIGTTVTVQAENFPTRGYSTIVEVTFDDQTIGHAAPRNGRFNFTFSIPFSTPGAHLIKATDGTGATASIAFQVLPALSVNIQVGSIYFPQDTVLIYSQVKLDGQLSSLASFQLQLLLPNGTIKVLTTEAISPGMYRTIFVVPKTGPFGTFLLIGKSHLDGSPDASETANFEVKQPWLSQRGNQVIVGVAGFSALGLAVVAWRKGYFSRKDAPPGF